MDYLTVMESHGIEEGFPGQVVAFSPQELCRSIARHPLVAGLHALHLGWFPRAGLHRINRPSGASDAILIVITAGRGWIRRNGRREPVGRGRALLIPSGCPHSYGAEEGEPWSLYWAHFGGTTAAAYHAILPDGVGDVPEAFLRDISRIFRHQLSRLNPGYGMPELLLASHALRHILGLLVYSAGSGGRSEPPAHNLTTCLDLLRREVSRPISQREMAASVGLSPSRFAALFKQQTGVSPVDYHIRLRMRSACELLDTTALGVQEIAARLGYDDPFYFSRIFKRVTGYSPSDYRLAVKG